MEAGSRSRRAATRVSEVYPGPVGELLARELRAYAELGPWFGPDRLMERLVGELLEDADESRADESRADDSRAAERRRGLRAVEG